MSCSPSRANRLFLWPLSYAVHLSGRIYSSCEHFHAVQGRPESCALLSGRNPSWNSPPTHPAVRLTHSASFFACFNSHYLAAHSVTFLFGSALREDSRSLPSANAPTHHRNAPSAPTTALPHPSIFSPPLPADPRQYQRHLTSADKRLCSIDVSKGSWSIFQKEPMCSTEES